MSMMRFSRRLTDALLPKTIALKFKYFKVRNLRGLRVLRGEIVFSIQETKSDASENLHRPQEL